MLEERFGAVPERVDAFQRSLRAVRTDRRKYVRASGGTERLYDLAADPGETTPVAPACTDRAADLEATLDRWLSSFEHAGVSETVEVAESTERRLVELGYL